MMQTIGIHRGMGKFTRRLSCLGAVVLCLAASASAAFVSMDLKTFTAEAVVDNNPPVPVPGSVSIQAPDLARGHDYTLSIPVRDTLGRPMANYVVTITLTGPDGKSRAFFVNTNAQGVAVLNLPAGDIDQLGQYTVTVSGSNLSETSTTFMVLEPKKGGVAVGPNPFSPSDPVYNQARFMLIEPSQDPITLEIYRLDGAKVFSRDFSPAAVVAWNGRNFEDQRVQGGIYIWQLKTGSRKINGTVVVVR